MIFGPITFIQISRSRGGENFGGDTGEDTKMSRNHVTKFFPPSVDDNFICHI